MGRFVGWCVYFLGDGHRVFKFLRAQLSLREGWPSSAEMFEANPVTVAEIAQATGFSEWRVRVCLRHLQCDDLAEQDDSKRWRIPFDF